MSVNALFVQFLQEIIDQEENLNLQMTYSRAQASIKQHPVLLKDGNDCLQLKYVGPKIAQFIDKKLRKYSQNHDVSSIGQSLETLVIPNLQTTGNPTNHAPSNSRQARGPEKDSKRKQKRYIPSFRSGGYAILLALLKYSGNTKFMSKEQIVENGQQFCDRSFKFRNPNQMSYTPWSSMKTLIEKDLVISTGRPMRYTLTDEGIELAKILNQSVNQNVELNVEEQSKSTTAPKTSLRTFVPSHDLNASNATASTISNLSLGQNTFLMNKRQYELQKEKEAIDLYQPNCRILTAGTFDILIVIDNREVRRRDDRDYFQLQLEQKGVKVLTRTLELGDVCWVARSRTNLQDVFLLDYIVERKCNSDLIASIQDNRFKEQKHRLTKCGISNLVYLVEGYDNSQFSPAAMTTAITETMISHNFFVKITGNAEETVDYLVKMTNLIDHQYRNVDLFVLEDMNFKKETYCNIKRALSKQGKNYVIPIQLFNSLNTKTKTLTHRDIWQKQLLTIRGISQEKARIISKKYPTFTMLMIELLQCRDADEQAKIFTQINIGSSLAKKLVELFVK